MQLTKPLEYLDLLCLTSYILIKQWCRYFPYLPATTTLRKSWNMLNNDRIIMNYWQKNFTKTHDLTKYVYKHFHYPWIFPSYKFQGYRSLNLFIGELMLLYCYISSQNSYEQQGKFRRQVKAQKLWFAILEAQTETGTPYMLYKDACNRKSNQQVNRNSFLQVQSISWVINSCHNLSPWPKSNNMEL